MVCSGRLSLLWFFYYCMFWVKINKHRQRQKFLNMQDSIKRVKHPKNLLIMLCGVCCLYAPAVAVLCNYIEICLCISNKKRVGENILGCGVKKTKNRWNNALWFVLSISPCCGCTVNACSCTGLLLCQTSSNSRFLTPRFVKSYAGLVLFS